MIIEEGVFLELDGWDLEGWAGGVLGGMTGLEVGHGRLHGRGTA
jgi:hypothetical protein